MHTTYRTSGVRVPRYLGRGFIVAGRADRYLRRGFIGAGRYLGRGFIGTGT